jgi:hypothetical protein
MSIFKSRDEGYEELGPPVARRGQRKLLNYILASILVVSLVAVVTVVIVNSSGQAGPESGPKNEIDSEPEVPILQASGSGSGSYVLRAEGDPSTTAAPEEDILVEIDQGSLRGKRLISRGGREYSAFYGIPYAKPPLGELRFQVSVFLHLSLLSG